MRVAIYTRVSTEEQAQEGYSIGEQDRRGRKFVDGQEDWTDSYVETFEEAGVSGTLRNRPQLDRLLARLDEFDVVVICSLDRLGRSTKNLLELYDRFEAAGVALVSLRERLDTGTPVGRLLRTVLSAIAEFERDLIGERTSTGLSVRARGGKQTGGKAPYGYRWEDKLLVVVSHEKEIVVRIFTDYCRGMSQRAIIRSLKADGVPTRRGGGWHQSAIVRILTGVVYRGKIDFKGEIVDGVHEAIVTEELWERARQAREDNHRSKGGHLPDGLHLCTNGVLRCGRCGSAMLCRKGRPGESRDRYVCSGRIADRTSCDQPSILRELVDEPFLAHLLDGYVDIEATRRRIEERTASAVTLAREAVSDAEGDVIRIERAIATTERDYDAGAIDGRQYAKREARLSDELDGARNALVRASEHAQDTEHAGLAGDAEQLLLEHLAAVKRAVVDGAGDAPDLNALRNVIGQMFESVVLMTGFGPPHADSGVENGFWEVEANVGELAGKDGYWLLPVLKWSAVDKGTFIRQEIAVPQITDPKTFLSGSLFNAITGALFEPIPLEVEGGGRPGLS